MADDPDIRKYVTPIGDPPVAYEITNVKGFADALGACLAPVFAEQREVWEREGPAAEARAAALGVTIDTIGGNCPVQGEGSFDDAIFYFRARHDEWQFHVWRKTELREHLPFGKEDWLIERPYGAAFEAGWMHNHEAIGFICDSVEEYRARVPADD